MKKIIFAFIAITSMTMEAQNITDIVRYSSAELNGTARYRAMSGAFGALGGDLSSLNVNPAGSAVLLNSIASFTMDIKNTENGVTYNNGFNTNSNYDVNLGQAGAAFVFNNYDESDGWQKFTIAFNYNETAGFQDNFLATGRNNNSIDRYFLDFANGVPLELLQRQPSESISDLYSFLGEQHGFGAQQAYLGYEGYILEPDADDLDNTSYYSAVAPGVFDQEYSYTSTGLNGKFTFNFAAQYQDFLYLGINLNSHFINYERTTSLLETNTNEGSSINEIYFEDQLSTLGNGFSLQLGALARVGDHLRLGAAYESPTWYTISEETTQYLETYSNEFGEAVVDPNIINIYPDYKIQTPASYTGSLAYLFGTSALISFDYTYKDFGTARFRPTNDPVFGAQNDLIEEELQATSSYRIGGEYRMGAFSLRGGYRFEESPYRNALAVGDLEGYSAGFGYDFGNVRLDAAYTSYYQDRNPRLYQTGLSDRAYIEGDHNNYSLTLTIGI